MNVRNLTLASDETDASYFPPDGYVFNTHTAVVREFIGMVKSEGIEKAIEWMRSIEDESDFSHPAGLSLAFPGEAPFRLEISENGSFENSRTIECAENNFTLFNLKSNCRYFWRVNGKEANSFSTADNEWRFIKIDGVSNVRDLGGRRIKEGLLFRGSELLGSDFKITEAGKETLRDQLSVKTELDLRLEYLGRYGDETPVEGVALKQMPYRPYVEIFEEKHRRGIVEIMNFLSDESVYPIYFHCMGGADRTGMIALYLEALADESEEDIFLDYELTSIARIYNPQKAVTDNMYRSHTYDYFQDFLKELRGYAPDKGLKEQVKAFLLDSGVTEETLEKITKIIKK